VTGAEARVTAGPDAGRALELPLGRRVVVGRGVEADLRLVDAATSRRHVALELRADGVVVEDLGSAGGTRLGGARLGAPALVRERAELALGGTRLEVTRRPAAPPRPAVPGVVLERRLGAGGSGAVYAGALPDGRPVAVKVLDPAADEETRRRFEREVRICARLDHPVIARVLELRAAADGRPVLVRELVPGPTLAERVRDRGPLAAPEALGLGAALADGLAHAHARGVVHRDVKPANVVLAPAGPRLIDFDLARRTGTTAGALTRLTASGQGLGTLAYVAPEQLDDARTVDGRADVYGLGLTLHFALGGRRPFDDVAPEDFLEALRGRGPTPLAGVPDAVAAAVARAHAPEREARYPDAGAMAAALRARVGGH